METTEGSYEGQNTWGTGAAGVNVGTVERWGSVALGATFAVLAFRRGGAAGALLMASAGGLWLRGMTGHCHAYGALGIDRSGTPDAWSSDSPGHGSAESGWPGRKGGQVPSTREGSFGEGPGAPEERFELHASDDGIHGAGTDRTEPYPR